MIWLVFGGSKSTHCYLGMYAAGWSTCTNDINMLVVSISCPFWRRYLTFCIFMALICRLYANFQHTNTAHRFQHTPECYAVSSPVPGSLCAFDSLQHRHENTGNLSFLCRERERSERKMRQRDRGKANDSRHTIDFVKFFRMKTLFLTAKRRIWEILLPKKLNSRGKKVKIVYISRSEQANESKQRQRHQPLPTYSHIFYPYSHIYL